MTPNELRAARKELGLSTAGLARALRLGKQGARTVRRWEVGENDIPVSAQAAIEMMLEERKIRG
jgi:DNA-binding transcriptional regulator YiaG